jgi:hydroxymethylglutaryl-CoA synthase
MTIPLNAPTAADVEIPRPKDVGVLAMEVYFPRRVRCFII